MTADIEAIEDVVQYVEDEYNAIEECDCSRPLEEQGHCSVPEPPCSPDSPYEQETPREEVLDTDICGLIRYVRMDGTNSIYRGVRYGSAWIVESENGKVLGASKVHIVSDPDKLWSLKPNQGWNCGNPW